MAQVTLRNLNKVFGKVVAVDDLNLEIQDNEFVALLGPSGCGKTTTLRMIAGLEKPTSGEVLINRQAVTRVPPNHRDIAMVFQSYALYPHMDVFGNIGFALRMMKMRKDEIRRRVINVAELLSISELLDRKPRELSGGQRQRVALGRAIVRQPAAYLLDEPLSNLDAQLRSQMRVELKRLKEDIGGTFIYVTHDQVEALTMSDRIALMNNGKLEQCAGPDEIYARPRTRFVAGFIGSPPMNFLEGRLVSRDSELAFETNGHHYPLSDKLRASLREPDDGNVTLGVRAERIKVVPLSESSQGLDCIVYAQEPLGSETILTLDVHGTLFKVRAGAQVRVDSGASVRMTFDPDDIHLFATTSGVAIS